MSVQVNTVEQPHQRGENKADRHKLNVADHGSRWQQGSDLRKEPREDLKYKCADNNDSNSNAETHNNNRHLASRSESDQESNSAPGPLQIGQTWGTPEGSPERGARGLESGDERAE